MDNSDSIQYKVRKSLRARRMRITVYRDGSVVATVPKNMDENLLVKFITEKKDWIMERVQKFLGSPLRFVRNSSKKDYQKYKAEARELVEKRLEFFNQRYQLKYHQISIRNQKTRWGSCSRHGNLNFNYKIVFLLAEIRDYIIVHELCHLKEFNHSRNFWNLVALTIPNYKQIRWGLKLS
jgi:predicted metal-dependent hydrolase